MWDRVDLNGADIMDGFGGEVLKIVRNAGRMPAETTKMVALPISLVLIMSFYPSRLFGPDWVGPRNRGISPSLTSDPDAVPKQSELARSAVKADLCCASVPQAD